MALTYAQKSDVRRHLGYEAIGLPTISPAGQNFAQGSAGYRFFQAYGFLEYKMNNLNADEEARLIGKAFGAVALVGPQPNNGDTVSVTFSGGPLGSPQTITATAAPAQSGIDQRLNLVASLAAACALNPTLTAAGFIGLAPYGTGPFAANAVPVPEVGFICPQAFTIAGSGSGLLVPTITANGALLPPVTQLDGINNTYGYLPILNGLEGAYLSTSQNLDTAKASVWTHDGQEAAKRRSLYENFRQMMADFIGVPMNSRMRQRPMRTGAIRYA